MIRITYSDEHVRIEGHAGYAPAGSDIVCAAVSVLAETFVMSMQDMTNDIISVEDDTGLMDIKLGPLSERGTVLMRAFLLGADAIAFEYPDYVSLGTAGRDVRP